MSFLNCKFTKLVAGGALLLLMSLTAWGQVTPTGTIFGVVKDPSGGAVPRASVTLTDVESGVSRTATTGDDGAYRFPALAVGHYTVKVDVTGFKAETQTGITLDVAQEEAVNFTLQIGTTEQQVVITSEAPQVDTTTSSLGSVVSEDQVADLPLNGRNFVDLTLLQPGVVNFQGNTFGANNLYGEFYTSNGAPIRSNMYTLDGAIMGNIVGASASSISGNSLGIDGIREYKVMTSTFSAEYGLAMGSQMTIVTKSGTNQFHGDAFDYLRNSVLDARNYFDVLYTLPTTTPEGGKRISPFRRNQFGGSIGGPIKKDKTFFFATYEGFRQLLDNPPALGITPTMPAACHVTPVNGVETVTSACDATLKNGATENIAPVMQPLVALWPLPNIEPGDIFAYLSSQINHENYVQGRVDHNISSSDTLFGRYTLDNDNEDYPYIFPYVDSLLDERQQYVTIAENHIFNPVLLNSARISYSRAKQVVSTTQAPTSPVPTSVACNPALDFVAGVGGGSINISPLANFHSGCASGLPTGLIQNVYSFGDDVFLTKGKHSLKFGTLINYFQQDYNPAKVSAGSTSWSNLHNFLIGDFRSWSVSLASNNPQRDSLFDTVGFYIQDDYRVLPRLTLNLGLRYEFNTQENEKKGRQSYFADPPYSDSYTLGPVVEDPSHRNVSPRIGFAWDVFGDGKTSLRGGFAILYDIANLGQIYATGGPPYSNSYTFTNPSGSPLTLTLPLPVPASIQNQTSTNPVAQGSTLTTVQRNYTSPHILDFNLTAERQLPFNMALSVAFAGSRGLSLWQAQGNEVNPFCPTTNTFVPQGCTGFTTVVANATPTWLCPTPAGSSGTCPSGTSAPRLNPYLSNVMESKTSGESWYNALEINLTKKVGHGLEFQSAYTYSRAYDDTEGFTNSDSSAYSSGLLENPFRPQTQWGPSNFDVRQNWRFNAIYHLPTIVAHGFADKLANGWWTGNIVSVQTGLPFTPVLSSDREQAGEAGSLGGWEQPDYVTAQNIAAVTAAAVAAGVTTCPANEQTCVPYNPVIFNPKTVYTHTVGQWWNANMFAIQPVGTIGDVGRNSLRDPGLWNWDFSLNKDTKAPFLGEAGVIQFRAEFFNILNHTNFGPSQNNPFSGSVKDNNSFTPAQQAASQGYSAENPALGYSASLATATSARQIQFSLKVIF